MQYPDKTSISGDHDPVDFFVAAAEAACYSSGECERGPYSRHGLYDWQGRALPVAKACSVSETVEGDFVRQHGRAKLAAFFDLLGDLCERAALDLLGVWPAEVFTLSRNGARLRPPRCEGTHA